MTANEKKSFVYGAMAVILLLSLFDMPYGFYTLVRFLSTIGFAYFAYNAYKDGNSIRMVFFIALALLFQPFVKLALGRVLWNVIDIVIAVYLCYLIIRLIRR